jgi:phosphoribosylamine--glycine ligase
MAGVKNEDGFRTNGGRVLNLVALGDNLEVARKNAYEDIKKITFEKSYYRKDIGEVK